jgi:predicted transcriptional regulator
MILRLISRRTQVLTNDQCKILFQWLLQTGNILRFGMIYAAKKRINSWTNLNSWAMENKYITLQTIYDIVKDDAHPTSTIVFPNEVIVRQNFPWDESIKYIDELCSENLVEIIQLSPAVIYLTDKGFQYILSAKRSRRVA